MSNKQELVERIIQFMKHWDRGDAEDRKVLESSSIADLQTILSDTSEKYKQQQEDETLQARASYAATQAMAELAKKELQESRRPALEAQQKEQLDRDRRTFTQAARKLKFSLCEANFSVIKQTLQNLGKEFTIQNIEDNPCSIAVGIELLPATPTELQKWQNEDIAARNQFLKTTDPQTLRREAQTEAVTNRETAALTAFEAELIAGLTRESDKPNLPEYWGSKRLDKEFIKRADRETLRQIIRRHGSSRLTARIHSITKIGNFSL